MARYIYLDVREKNILVFREEIHDFVSPLTLRLPKWERLNMTFLFLIGFATFSYVGYKEQEEEKKAVQHKCNYIAELKRRSRKSIDEIQTCSPTNSECMTAKKDIATQTDDEVLLSKLTSAKYGSPTCSVSSDDDFETVD